MAINLEDAPDPKEDKAVARTKPQSQSADPRQAVNAKSLVRAGKKMAVKAASTAGAFGVKQLRQIAGTIGKTGGRAWGPVMLAEQLLKSKKAGVDQWGRQVDTPAGFKAAQLDDQVVSQWINTGRPPMDLMEKNGDVLSTQYIIQKVGKIQAQNAQEQMMKADSPEDYAGSPINASFDRLRRQKQQAELLRQESAEL
tara:strand:+ start:848 stop:1438 length:591 start_codon:yes stop_codon:yes gene_type:complete